LYRPFILMKIKWNFLKLKRPENKLRINLERRRVFLVLSHMAEQIRVIYHLFGISVDL
jgi:hypothetical protein